MALDNIYEVRLCCFTQNYTNNQSKIRKMLAVLFAIKCKKKCSRSKIMPKKVLALSGRDYTSLYFFPSPVTSSNGRLLRRFLSDISTRSQKYLELSILKFSSPFPVFLVFLTFADKDLKLNFKKKHKKMSVGLQKKRDYTETRRS